VIDLQTLEQTIDVLRRHRILLGDEVVATAVAALQEKIAALTVAPFPRQMKNIVVLQADLSDFTAMSSGMDPEQVGDTVNALWQRLDSVVRAWGGAVEKHTGDGLIALFGMPDSLEDDAERAVLAALDMQLELTLFNEAMRQRPEIGPLARRRETIDLQMRIGLHCGPVVMAAVGVNEEVTAVGETMALAERLETAAPVGGVLISADVYRAVMNQFDVELVQNLAWPGRPEGLPVYVVRREKARPASVAAERLPRARFVGRAAELERLQYALLETMDNSAAQLVALIGDDGVGKSRLWEEFERWLRLLPAHGCVLRAQADEADQTEPYALIANFFRNQFHIHRRSSPAVAREKFARGVTATVRADQAGARAQAHVMGHLLGFDFAHSPYLEELLDDPARLQSYAFTDIARFLADLVDGCPPTVWLIEDAHWADAASLDLLEYLLTKCADLPLLIVCLARPELLAQRPSWTAADPFNPITVLPLLPLSPIDSRHLVAHLLERAPHLPLKLIDLIVHSAQGNPLYVRQMVHLMGDAGILLTHGEQWPVNLQRLSELAAPNSLTAVFAARLAYLSPPEQMVLAAAAMAGYRFTTTAVLALLPTDQPQDVAQLDTLLRNLVQKELLRREHAPALTGGLTYRFVSNYLRQVVIEQQLLRAPGITE
jgi:class 3 adenylate cyclase